MALEAAFPGTTVHCQPRPAPIATLFRDFFGAVVRHELFAPGRGARRCPASQTLLATLASSLDDDACPPDLARPGPGQRPILLQHHIHRIGADELFQRSGRWFQLYGTPRTKVR
jgi:hypothetical protein